MAMNQPTPTSPAEKPTVFDSGSVLELLMTRAAGSLSKSELQWLALNGPGHAHYLASNGAKVIDGLGCLVAGDGEQDGPGVGSFQSSHDVPLLAFHVGELLRQIDGLLTVGGMAADMLEP